jgi:hypothetical protein
VRGEAFRWADVVLAAAGWGELEPLIDEIRAGLVAQQELMAAGGQVADEDLRAATAQFRYGRRLLSADELDDWLQRWHVTHGQWVEFLGRGVLRSQREPDARSAEVPSPDVLWIEAVCSGRLENWSRRLAGQVAVAGADTPGPAPPHEPVVATGRLVGLAPEDAVESAARNARIDAGFRAFCEKVTNPGALQAEIAAHHMDWIRVEADAVSMESPDAAREVMLGVEEDGADLAEMAAAAGVPLREMVLDLEQIPPDIAPQLLSAAEGDLTGPLRLAEDAWLVLRIRRKVVPDSSDPEIRDRAGFGLVGRAVEQEAAAAVRWYGD